MEEEPDCHRMPPEDLRCSYRDEASVRCRNWRIQDRSFCQVHFLEDLYEGTMMVEKKKGTTSSVRVSKDEIEKTASAAAAPRRKGRGKKGKIGSRRKRGRNEDDEVEKEVIPERKVRKKLEETEEMNIEEEEVDVDDSNADEAPKHRGRKPAK